VRFIVQKFRIVNEKEETKQQIMGDIWEAGQNIGFMPCHLKLINYCDKANKLLLGVIYAGVKAGQLLKEMRRITLDRKIDDRKYAMFSMQKNYEKTIYDERGKGIWFENRGCRNVNMEDVWEYWEFVPFLSTKEEALKIEYEHNMLSVIKKEVVSQQ